MMGIHRELRASREDMQNLIQAIKTSQEDFQRAATRIETLEFEWTVWNTEEGQAPLARDLSPGLPGSSGAGLITQPPVDLLGFDEANQAQSSTDGPTEFQLTPTYTPRSGGSQETEHQDSLMEWWRNPSPQGRPQSLGPARGPVTEGNLLQLTTGDRVTATMDPDAPPGFGLTMDPAIGNLSRRRPEGPIPATHRANGETGSGGGACLIQYSASTPTLPDVTSVRTQAAPSADDSDVFSFLAGMRPRDHLEESPTLYSTATPGRGVAPESAGSPSNSRKTELSQSAGRSGPSTFQSMSAVSPAPVTTPSMGELNMILKTLQTLVPEFPKLDPGDPSTRARRFQQWLLQVTQSLEPAGSHVTA